MSSAPKAVVSYPFDVAATGSGDTPKTTFRLTELVAMQAAMKPDLPFLATFQGTETTVPALTFRQGEMAILRLARFFRDLRLAQGDVVALVMPNVAEASLSLLAILQAGLRPLLVPTHLPFGDMLSLVQASDAKAIITTGTVPALALPECLAHVAAAAAHVRFVMSFGQTKAPGLLPLDPLLRPDTETSLPAAVMPMTDRPAETILIGAAEGRFARRSVSCLVSSALQLIAQAHVEQTDTIATTLATDDGAALASGLIAALLIGARLTHIPADHAVAFMRDHGRERVVLVWPGSLEAVLEDRETKVFEAQTRLVLVHQTPFERTRAFGRRKSADVTDLWAFEEKAISIARRGSHGVACLAPASAGGGDTPCEVRITEDGRLLVRGESVEPEHADGDGWCDLGLRVFSDWEQDVLAIETAA